MEKWNWTITSDSDFPSLLLILTMTAFFSSRDAQDMADTSFSFRATMIRHLWGGLATVGVLLLLVQPTGAQSFQEYDSRNEGAQQQERLNGDRPSSGAPSNLPDWAEPSQPQSPSPGQRGDPSGGPQGKAMGPPDPPDNPSRVPVDGGLSLLAAAGAGYAIRKLSEDEEEEEDDLPA